MEYRKFLAISCVMSLLGSTVQATTVQDVQTTLAADSTLLSSWMSNQLKYVIPFNSTSGNVVPNQVKLFGFEAGVEGVASSTKIDNDGLHNLPTNLIDSKTIDSFSRLPMPLVLAHAKIGLPFGLDAGVRFGGIPKTTEDHGNSKTSVKNKVFGLDLRKKIIDEGAMKPFGLTLGLNYTHADGSLDVTNTYDSLADAAPIDGHNVSIAGGATTEHADWKTNSVGLQAVLDKQIFFITPYIGASVNRNSGDIHNSITTTGTPYVDGIADPAGALTAIGTSTNQANKWDCRGLLGIEFSILPFVKLGLQGEYAGDKNMAGALGLRIQFH